MDLGLAHEQQHQELLLTDILHAFAQNPLYPAYRSLESSPAAQPGGGNPGQLGWARFEGGLVDIGAPASAPFVFDNERPRHRVWLEPFTLSTRLVTVEEMKAFIDADGYRTPSLWLSDGYDWVRAHGVEAPLYWHLGDVLRVFGLDGLRQPDKDEPVAHVSYYEADAVARFLGARLPTEQEWEAASASAPTSGNFRESGALRPLPAARPSDRLSSMFGNAWEWTQSSYAPYPGYRPGAGALGEYNGKFMVNQHVLRGGSCLTPAGHVRPSYRNFWHPETRFQMTGIRLAKSL
jgi:ergothioneine biosynthesis protein EgtB